MFLMVRNDLFQIEPQNVNSRNIQEKPTLTVTKNEELQTGQKDFFNVRKLLMRQTRKESESNYIGFPEEDNHKSKHLKKDLQ